MGRATNCPCGSSTCPGSGADHQRRMDLLYDGGPPTDPAAGSLWVSRDDSLADDLVYGFAVLVLVCVIVLAVAFAL